MVATLVRQVFLEVSTSIVLTIPKNECFGNPGERSREEDRRPKVGLKYRDSMLRLFVETLLRNRSARGSGNEGLSTGQSRQLGGSVWIKKHPE